MKSTTRRSFIGNSAKAGIASLLIAPSLHSIANTIPAEVTGPLSNRFKTGFDQQPLAYAYNALEPYVDAQTMDIHYNKHAGTYSKNLKEAALAEKVETSKSVEDILASISKYSSKMRNNAGGHFNHELFWKCMTPNGAGAPKGKLLAAIEKQFTSLDGMKKEFSQAGKDRFGSGWAWLLLTGENKLVVSSTPNQDNPLMDLAEVKGTPLLGLDVWEHAYYLKYQNRRPEYIENFWKIVNWDYVAERFSNK